jgi:hypothetical protein
MFEAYAIVCAASLSFGIYTDSCFILEDSWGPYETIQNCNIRRAQIVDDVLNGSMRDPIFMLLRYPEQIYAEGICTKISNDIES